MLLVAKQGNVFALLELLENHSQPKLEQERLCALDCDTTALIILIKTGRRVRVLLVTVSR